MTAPTVVVMAAGQGTRMRSSIPKVLHDLCGRPLIAWPIAAAQDAGAGRIVVVDGAARSLEGHLPDDVIVAVQPQANGTGGAVAAAAEHVDGSAVVVVISGDVPLISAKVISELVGAHAYQRAAATVATAVLDDPSGYGRIVRDAEGHLERIAETKAAGDATPEELAIDEINAGIYVFDAGALLHALPGLKPDNAQRELYLPDVLTILHDDGATIAAHDVRDPAVVLGVNDRAQLATVRAIARRRILEAHMLAGVDITDPGSTVIDADVVIGPDTVIEPFTILHGRTTVGEGARIGPGSTLTDVTVGDGAVVLHAYAVEARIGAGVSVGPFAYLRPGTVLRDRAKVGTFVEVKNSDIGEGAKVPHLSYIGDADVGAGSNLGAGSITANYDGQSKHRTTIGEGVKGSVHTSYVAPVTLGDRAWTAAGSVVTKDVPAGALAVARERQVNIEGYDERRRAAAVPKEET